MANSGVVPGKYTFAAITVGPDGRVTEAASGALPGSFSGFANPTAQAGLTAVNGSATTAMRSDAAPAINQGITPTWTAVHTFSATPVFSAGATISGANPKLTFTDTTASAKSLVIDVDANRADLRESAGASGSLVFLDLANNRFGLGTSSPSVQRHQCFSNSGTNDVQELTRLERKSSGTTTSGFGLKQTAYLQNGSGSSIQAHEFNLTLGTVTAGSESAVCSFKAVIGGTLRPYFDFSGSPRVTFYRYATGQSTPQGSATLNTTDTATIVTSGLGPKMLFQVADSGPTTSQNITGATNASPIVITITGHGYSTNDKVTIAGVLGNTAANGTWTITVVNSNTFSLNGSTSNGAYTSGGTCTRISSFFLGGLAFSFDMANSVSDIQFQYRSSLADSSAVTVGFSVKGSNGCVGIGMTSQTHTLQLVNDDAAKTATTTWATTSDRRTKRNIRPFSAGLDVIKQLNPVEFEYNGLAGTPEGQRAVSLIAQDLLGVHPDLVRTNRRRLRGNDEMRVDEARLPAAPAADDPEIDIYTFNPHNLFFLLINAVKELDERIGRLDNSRHP